jgi:hypothetical protein
MNTPTILKDLPKGAVGNGVTSTSGGKQQYTSPDGTYVQNEYDVGKPTYRTDYSFTPNAPVAPPASPIPTTTGNPIVDNGVRRYTDTPTPGSADAIANDYYGGLDTNKPDENAIRQKVIDQMQSQIDGINQVYNGMVAAEKPVGEDRLGRTRAINARSGDLGGDFGNKNMEDTTAFNKEKVDAINARRSAEIAAVWSNINTRADAATEKAQENYFKNNEAKLAYKRNTETEAIADAERLAKTGVSLQDLTTEEYNALLKQTGLDPIVFESRYNAAKNMGSKIDYTYHNLGNGKVLRTGVSADGKAVQEKEFDYGVPPDYSLTSTNDGTLIMLNKATGETKTVGKYAKPSGDGAGTFTSGKLSLSSGQLSTMEKNLQDSKSLFGGDGKYVNPEIYQQAYDEWTSAGGLSKDFITKFPPNNFVNPANTQLPQYLQSTTKGGQGDSENDLKFN